MSKNRRLIVFLIPPKNKLTGGIISIFSICDVSRRYKDIHKSEVVIATYPGHDSYRKETRFDNDETILSFDEVVKMGPPQSLQLHVPEYASSYVFERLEPYQGYLKAIPELSVNILNQNILLLEPPEETADWFRLTPTVTQTTAHDIYSSQALADIYNFPTHHLSAFVDARQYKWVDYADKQPLIALSPDKNQRRDEVMKILSKQLPEYKLITIQDMKYEDYKELISTAKYTITFGEGFDGYFVEPFLTGGMSFTVYNDDFFPDKEFASFKNVYPDYKTLAAKVVKQIQHFDQQKSAYEKVVRQNYDKINHLYNYERYMDKVKHFYLKDYSYLPTAGSAEKLIGKILDKQASLVAQSNSTISQQAATIEQTSVELAANKQLVSEMLHSSSWRVTAPLRKANTLRGKGRKSKD